jgi:4-hydroxythreonine-4-phosphate dehydrogenase
MIFIKQVIMEKPIVGITAGDLNGIGLELIVKVFSDVRMLDICTPVVFASNKVVNYYRKLAVDFPFNFSTIKDLDQINPKQVNVLNCWDEEVEIQPGQLTEAGGQYAVRSLIAATTCLKEGTIDAMVTAPIHKHNTQSPAFNYTGHTPYLQETFGAQDVVMMLYNGNFRVGLVTEHIPVAQVATTITSELIVRKAQLLKNTLVKDFGIDKPRIAILGLNPHAGDHGVIGEEELTIITPAIEQLKSTGTYAFGPYSADGFFAQQHYQQFDAVLAMYHDQGLIPFKALNSGEGVNYTCGLPVIRTSPDHGTAYDIAGKNIAHPESMREAVYQAVDILRQRKAYEHFTANPLQRQRLSKER